MGMTNLDKLYPYERRIVEAEELGLDVHELNNMTGNLKGVYIDSVILLKDSLSYVEKNCIMAEEIGHHFETTGDITDQSRTENRRQEQRARSYGYMYLLSLPRLIAAYEHGCRNRFEAAEYLDVTEDFFDEAIRFYFHHFGYCAYEGDYIIYFNDTSIRVQKLKRRNFA